MLAIAVKMIKTKMCSASQPWLMTQISKKIKVKAVQIRSSVLHDRASIRLTS